MANWHDWKHYWSWSQQRDGPAALAYRVVYSELVLLQRLLEFRVDLKRVAPTEMRLRCQLCGDVNRAELRVVRWPSQILNWARDLSSNILLPRFHLFHEFQKSLFSYPPEGGLASDI